MVVVEIVVVEGLGGVTMLASSTVPGATPVAPRVEGEGATVEGEGVVVVEGVAVVEEEEEEGERGAAAVEEGEEGVAVEEGEGEGAVVVVAAVAEGAVGDSPPTTITTPNNHSFGRSFFVVYVF